MRPKSPPHLRNQLRYQPAVYQLHLVQDLSFLRGNAISAVGTPYVGTTITVYGLGESKANAGITGCVDRCHLSHTSSVV